MDCQKFPSPTYNRAKATPLGHCFRCPEGDIAEHIQGSSRKVVRSLNIIAIVCIQLMQSIEDLLLAFLSLRMNLLGSFRASKVSAPKPDRCWLIRE